MEYMKESQKKKNEDIINSYMKNQIFFDGLYSMLISVWFLKSSFTNSIYINDKYLMTAFFGLFIFIDIFNSFNARTHRLNLLSNIFKNKVFIAIIIFIIIVQIFLIYYGGNLFRTTGLSLFELEIMILFASSVIPFDIIRKIILKKKGLNSGV